MCPSIGQVSSSYDDVCRTLAYVFTHHKRGIYVQIRNGALRLYVPFSNVNYRNQLSARAYDAIRKAFPTEHQHWAPAESWYADGCLIKPMKKWLCNTPDWYYGEYLELLGHLIKRHGSVVPDADFIINTANFPLLHCSSWSPETCFHPHDDIFDTPCAPAPGTIGGVPCRILSSFKRSYHNDILIPTGYDLQIATKKFFLGSSSRQSACTETFVPSEIIAPPKFAARLDKIIWRGSLSTCTTRQDSCRVKASRLSGPLFDTAMGNRFEFYVRKQENQSWHAASKHTSSKSTFITYDQMFRHKYVLVLGGTVSNSALAFYLQYGSVVIFGGDRNYLMWYSKLLLPGKHYIALDCAKALPDMQRDLEKVVNDGRTARGCAAMAKIAAASVKFYNTYITLDFMADYMLWVLCDGLASEPAALVCRPATSTSQRRMESRKPLSASHYVSRIKSTMI